MVEEGRLSLVEERQAYRLAEKGRLILEEERQAYRLAEKGRLSLEEEMQAKSGGGGKVECGGGEAG
jgi:hypothetical protein